MGVNQKNDAKFILGEWKNYGTLDYVSCWYKKTINYIENTNIKCALVSTNSICQGEQVINLWKPLMKMGLHIDFAYPSFEWKSEASDAAAITCIIIGFSVCKSAEKKKIYYSSGIVKEVDEIKTYIDCRYVSPYEACWRIFVFDIHFMEPAMERLSIHLPDEQSVSYPDAQSWLSILSRPNIWNTMFVEWMRLN